MNLHILFSFLAIKSRVIIYIAFELSFFYYCRYHRYYVPVAHPRYKREFHDKVIIESHGDNFSRSIVAVYPQGKCPSDYLKCGCSNTLLALCNGL